MGAVSRETYNYELMEQAEYTDMKKLRRLIKNYHNIKKLATMGDGVALSIYTDLRHLLYVRKIMTDKQMECVQAVLIEDIALTEYAGDTMRSEETIRNNISGGLKRLMKELESGHMYRKEVSTTDYILENYQTLGPKEIAKKLGITEQSVRVTYHRKKAK